MALPPLIEIVPPAGKVRGLVTVPGSKSITNRALVLAALAKGTTMLKGALWSEDTQRMVAALQKLGFAISVAPDPTEVCNRQIRIEGRGGVVPPGGSTTHPLEIEVGNAGTAARFLAALLCLGRGAYRLHGTERMHERPQAALFRALLQLGYAVDSPNGRLPAIIHGGGPRSGRCRVSVRESSQFASALLLCAGAGGWEVAVEGEDPEESPYVVMTSRLVGVFPQHGGEVAIEPDTSSGSYFWAAGSWAPPSGPPEASVSAAALDLALEPTVRVAHWPSSGWQVDERFPAWCARLEQRSLGFARNVLGLSGKELECVRREAERLDAPRLEISRRRDLGDSIMTAIVLAPLLAQPVRFTDLGRLRLQECERVQALRTELTRCGARVVETGDTLEVHPSDLHAAEILTYDDHRMAMCFAILGLKVPGLRIQNPACVRKTFPSFFQKLAAPPPEGLGVVLLDAATRRAVAPSDCLAG